MKTFFTLTIAAVVAAFVLTGCNKSETTGETSGDTNAPATTNAPPAP